MEMLVLIALLLALLGSSEALPCFWGWSSPQSGYTCVKLAPYYNLYYKQRQGASNISIGLEVAVPPLSDGSTVSWAGFGISQAGGMKGADIFTVHIDESVPSGGFVVDRWSLDFMQPEEDEQQNVWLKSFVRRPDGGFRAMIERPLDSCDPQDLRIELSSRTNIIWAVSTADDFSYHGPDHRGNAVIMINPHVSAHSSSGGSNSGSSSGVTKPAAQLATAGAATTLSLTMPNVSVKQLDDNYECVDFAFPTDRKRHIVSFKGVLSGSPENVHHIVLYQCFSKPSTFGKGVYNCNGMPLECLQFLLVWVPGTSEVLMPPEAGFAVGPGGLQYGALQVHYNNVQRLTDRWDSSGLSLQLTDTLRQYDMATLALGPMLFSIPANTPSFSLDPSWCPSQCTQKMNATSVKMTSLVMHMHKAGSNMVVRHLRGSQELRPLGSILSYDFRFQANNDVPADTGQLMPGDSLITECTYNTRERANKTNFGEGTGDEMCFAFISVYPKSNLTFDACFTLGQTAYKAYSGCLSLQQVGLALLSPSTSFTTTLLQLVASGNLVVASKPAYSPFSVTGPQCLARQSNSSVLSHTRKSRALLG